MDYLFLVFPRAQILSSTKLSFFSLYPVRCMCRTCNLCTASFLVNMEGRWHEGICSFLEVPTASTDPLCCLAFYTSATSLKLQHEQHKALCEEGYTWKQL